MLLLLCLLFMLSSSLSMSSLNEFENNAKAIRTRINNYSPKYAVKQKGDALDLDSVVKRLMNCPGTAPIPGMIVGVTKGEEVLYQGTFGYRDVESRLPVDTNTLFNIGSLSKQFTAILLAMLQDEGKLSWGEPVRTYVPWFTLYSDDNPTLTDLMAHRTGVPRNDMLWEVANFSVEELVRRIRYFPQNFSFRTTFQYNNLMVGTAGYIAGVIANTTLQNAIQSKIFDKLGMKNTKMVVSDAIATGYYAVPYGVDKKGQLRPFAKDVNNNLDVMAGAGGIISTLDDMLKWARFHARSGLLPDKTRLVSKAGLDFTRKAHMPLRENLFDETQYSSDNFPFSLMSDAYGIGWWLGTYRGYRLIIHTGHVTGMASILAVLPGQEISVFVNANLDQLGVPMWEVVIAAFDLVLGFPPVFNNDTLCTFPCPWDPQCKNNTDRAKIDKKESIHKGNASYASPLSDYVGVYTHPAYGPAKVTLSPDSTQLYLNSLLLPCVLTSEPYIDTFVGYCNTTSDLDPIDIMVHFSRNFEGKVSTLKIPLEDMYPPVEFTNTLFEPELPGYPQFKPIQGDEPKH